MQTIEVDSKTYEVEVSVDKKGWAAARCPSVPGAIVGCQNVFGDQSTDGALHLLETAIRSRVQAVEHL